MRSQQLFLPDKIKVGFQERTGTYTGKLAYVIYFDKKGVLRKETSWNSWRDNNIKPQEFENVATEGFVLNKGVGGARQSYGWNTRNEYIRVYDPRDFEFEISVANLLFILRECDCSRGKGLEGKFVYAWDGTELVLLPVSCDDYKNSQEFTELQAGGVKIKELKPGATYVTRRQKPLVFLGRFDYHYIVAIHHYDRHASDGEERVKKAEKDPGVGKRFVFWEEQDNGEGQFHYLKDVKSLGALRSADVHPEYANWVDQYNKSAHGSPTVKLTLQPDTKKPDPDRQRYWSPPWFYEKEPGIFMACTSSFTHDRQTEKKKIEYAQHSTRYFLRNGALVADAYGGVAYPGNKHPSPNSHHYYGHRHGHSFIIDWVEPTNLVLIAELASGAKFQVDYSTFSKD